MWKVNNNVKFCAETKKLKKKSNQNPLSLVYIYTFFYDNKNHQYIRISYPLDILSK